MSSGVKDIDKGLKRIVKELRLMQGAYTKVGVQAGTPRKAKPGQSTTPSMVVIAVANEFGVPEKHIPERSFLRSTHDEQKQTIRGLFVKEKDKIFTGKSDTRRSLGLIGEFVQGKIRAKIASNIQPGNAPSTARRKVSLGIKNKGSRFIGPIYVKTLVDTGQLLASIRHVEVYPSKAAA